MSGIAGQVRFDGRPVDEAELASMCRVLTHRGPDGWDMWRGQGVGLGHCMLWTTPESLVERLPAASQDGQVVLTADGRIDNRVELIERLRLDRYRDTVHVDSQLILAAYEKWGERCPAYLVGDFAFALWDAKKRQLFCARDCMGVRPFFYCHTGDVFAFASEVKALLRIADVPCHLNERRVGEFLSANFEDKRITFYRDIYRLPAAMTLIATRSGVQLRTYWEPDLDSEVKLGSQAEYTEAFREVFDAAVRCRLRSAYPVGATLSGGLDSSSVACTASKIRVDNGEQPLHTFSAIFPDLAAADPRIDERSFIHAVMQNGAFEPHFIYADRLSPLVPAFWEGDEAIPGVNLYLDHAFAVEANRHGVRVLLTGHDGDTVVSHGYERLQELARTLRWLTLLRESRRVARVCRVRWHRILWEQGMKPLLPRIGWQRGHDKEQDQAMKYTDRAINKEFAQRMGLATHARSSHRDISNRRFSPRQSHWNAINSGLMQYATEVVESVVAAHGVELRHPFLDKRLVEFSIALPLEQRLQRGHNRVVMRYAMEGRLPPAVQWRATKGKLGGNFTHGLISKERQAIEGVVFGAAEGAAKYVDVGDLQQVYRRFMARPGTHQQDGITLNLVYILVRWLDATGFTG
jgi:asparagine synthase (glutamine-hydrolysing)